MRTGSQISHYLAVAVLHVLQRSKDITKYFVIRLILDPGLNAVDHKQASMSKHWKNWLLSVAAVNIISDFGLSECDRHEGVQNERRLRIKF